MKSRQGLSRKASRKNFRRGAKVMKKNYSRKAYRGGIRL